MNCSPENCLSCNQGRDCPARQRGPAMLWGAVFSVACWSAVALVLLS